MPATVSPARLCADDDLGDVAHVDRRTVAGLQDHALDVGNVPQEPDASQVGLLPPAHEHAAAGIAVGPLQRVRDLPDGEAVLHEPIGVDEHLVLLHLPAEAVHLVHARHGLEQRRHDPVLERSQLHRGVALALQRVLEDLAEAGADRAELRRHAWRERLPRRREALEHHLARPPGVGAILEHHHHLGEAGLRERPDLPDAGQAAHRLLDGEADPFLDIHRGEAGSLGEHHHLGVRHVREGVDREAAPGGDAARRQEHGGEEDEEPVVEQPGDGLHGALASRHIQRPSSSAGRRT
jgi:hypothetical protein